MKLMLPAQLTSLRPKQDKSFSLTFTTQELAPSEALKLFEEFQNFGWLLFSPNELKDSDIPEEDAPNDTKSVSERLRAVLFVWWTQKYKERYPDFETWRRLQMEKIIDQVKDKLDT